MEDTLLRTLPHKAHLPFLASFGWYTLGVLALTLLAAVIYFVRHKEDWQEFKDYLHLLCTDKEEWEEFKATLWYLITHDPDDWDE